MIIRIAAVAGFGGVVTGIRGSLQKHNAVASSTIASAEVGGGPDWNALAAANGDAVAWLEVGRTPISLPVVHPSAPEEEDFYLSHGFDRKPSLEGTAYLDIRSSPDAGHLLVFGHHVILDERAQFSPIHRSFIQEVFDGIGTATWHTPQNPPSRFHPVMAVRTTGKFELIQRFRFPDDEDLHAWLRDLLHRSHARAEDADKRIGAASQALTLCTCSSERAGGRDRTLVIFARSR
ncbi:MAG: class B sortase [Coriobacteriaceae bacterium]|nr:class B sortase [Coriobacteriaceae bacterium]